MFSPKLAGFVLDAFTAFASADVYDELASLSARKREVLQHIARSYTYRGTRGRIWRPTSARCCEKLRLTNGTS